MKIKITPTIYRLTAIAARDMIVAIFTDLETARRVETEIWEDGGIVSTSILMADYSLDGSVMWSRVVKGYESEGKNMAILETEPMLQFFGYTHLPENLQAISKPFSDLAHKIVIDLPRNPERTVALRKLMEAKDCAVRANLYK